MDLETDLEKEHPASDGGREDASEEDFPPRQRSFLEILREGSSEPGDCGRSLTEKPPWLDKEKLLRVNDIYADNCPGILLGHFMGQALMSQVPALVQPLLHTGNHSTSAKAKKRAAMTLRYVIGWYKGSVWNPEDQAHNSIVSVRNMHRAATKSLEEALKTKKDDSDPWLSQQDMALTQFAFLGPLLLYGEQVGLFCSTEELECLVHFWRYIGFLLGMQDKYNLGSLSFEDLLSTCREIVREVCVPTFSRPSPEFTAIGMTGTEGYANFSPLLEYNAMHNFACQLMGIDNMWRSLSLRGYLCTCFVWLAPKLLGFQCIRKLTVPGYSMALEARLECFVKEDNECNPKTIPGKCPL